MADCNTCSNEQICKDEQHCDTVCGVRLDEGHVGEGIMMVPPLIEVRGVQVCDTMSPIDRDVCRDIFQQMANGEVERTWFVFEGNTGRVVRAKMLAVEAVSILSCAMVGRAVCRHVFDLTRHQRRTLLLTTNYACVKAAARAMGITHGTARKHIERAMHKTRSPGFNELLAWANLQQHALQWGPEFDAFLERRNR